MSATPTDLRPLRIGEILDVAVKIYTRNAATLFKVVAFVVIPVQVIAVLVSTSTIPDEFLAPPTDPFAPTEPVPEFDVADLWAFFAGNLIVIALGWLVFVLATGACFKAVSDAYLGAKPEWRSSLRFAWSHLGGLLWVTFLAGIGTAVGLLFCLVPGVWLWAAWGVAIPALLTENARGTRALSRSFHLVQGRWWQTFGTLALAALLVSVINGILGAGLMAVTFTGVGDNIFVTQVLNGVVGAVSSIVGTPFQAAVAAVVYFDLRVRKEGFDLQLLAQRMGTPVEGHARAALLPPPTPEPMFQPAAAPATHPATAGEPGSQPAVGLAAAAAVPYQAPPPANGLAVASLILGILWLVWIGSILAVIFGHVAKRQIDRADGAQGGRGIAVAGLALGWVGVGTLLLIVAIAVIASLAG